MKQNKHTPGPWHFAGGGIITNDQHDEIILGHLFDDSPDGNLVAAAPELLEALEHLSNELCEGEFVKHSSDAIRKIKSAIAKARGES